MTEPRRPTFRREAGNRSDARAEVDEELAYHLDRCVEELTNEGWTESEARAEAERRFGDLEATRAVCTAEHARARAGKRRGRRMDELAQDVRYALRTLRRAPTYAAVVVATLAVGIALNTLVFSLMNPYLVRALPYHEPGELVAVGGVDRLEGWDLGRFSPAQVADLEERTRAFQDLEYYVYGSANLAGDEGAVRASSAHLSGGLFGLLGMDAVRGRTLGPADAADGAPDVVVVSHGLWTRRLGADPDAVGSVVRLDGTPHTVVGVMPPDFNFPFNAIDLWLPLRGDPRAADRGFQNSLAVGRLADGWTPEAARAEISAIQADLAAAYPETDGSYETLSVKPLREALNFAWDILRPGFWILIAAVALVLLVACVNVASLTLARAEAREREVAVRAAVGAGRARLVRQLLAESVTLAVLGGILGVGLAVVGMRVVGGILPADLYRVGEVAVDRTVLLFSTALTLATPLAFGLAPAWHAARRGLAGILRSAGGAVGAGRGASRTRRALVVVQVTLAVVLVATTGLMVRSFAHAMDTDLGFDADRVLVATLTPAETTYPDGASLAAYYDDVTARLATLPGVESVGTVSHIPLNHETLPIRYTTPEGEDQPVEDRPSAYTSRAGPGYFAAMGIAVSEGRPFEAGDAEASGDAPGVVVSRGLADDLWPRGSAVGRTLVYGSGDDPVRAVVRGVVDDVYYDGVTGAPRPHVYRILEGTTTRRRFLTIRTEAGVEAATLTGPVRDLFRAVDPELPLTLRSMPDIVMESTGVWALGSGFLGAFGLVALGLAALGIYGLITFTVQRRTREMGLRLALGADAARLQASIVADGLRLTSVGLVLGLLLAVGAGAALAGALLGVGPADPVSLGGAAAVFALVATAASWLPARRAARVDPVRVLRSE